MKTYRVGTHLTMPLAANGLTYVESWQVSELEWVPPHQRLQVRMTNVHGEELALTPHELAINGAY